MPAAHALFGTPSDTSSEDHVLLWPFYLRLALQDLFSSRLGYVVIFVAQCVDVTDLTALLSPWDRDTHRRMALVLASSLLVCVCRIGKQSPRVPHHFTHHANECRVSDFVRSALGLIALPARSVNHYQEQSWCCQARFVEYNTIRQSGGRSDGAFHLRSYAR